ncbi:DUF4417 domain-containing protein [Butyrivibrio sp. MC2013]|uniref:DUF4417 domain-containing protein n=1 Tax=Butyrivibrio sp. MC2013 TaxID=1280686 RepID=UPI000410CFC4|nr:DUF4417 domain-containing protein [Butyrivibrio sp. MC2013]
MIPGKRKAIIDDGMNPELIKGAELDGILQIPKIKAPDYIFIPDRLIPYTKLSKDKIYRNTAVVFYEKDTNFSEILINPDAALKSLAPINAFITPDPSLYRNAPLPVQITNVYRNRAIGFYAQVHGFYVIPNIRWGTEETYTTKVLPEKIAFLGVPKHSIVAIGSYGCIQTKNDKYHFKAGLEEMLVELEPKDVLVYGAMPSNVFSDYERDTNFHHYDDWLSCIKKGDNYGKR